MNTLGLSCFLEDPAAALLVDGEVVSAVEEERLARVKHGVEPLRDVSVAGQDVITPYGETRARHFPGRSAEAVRAGAPRREDLDHVAIGFDAPNLADAGSPIESAFPGRPDAVARDVRSAYRGSIERVRSLAADASAAPHFVRHHKAHAYGAAFTSPFSRCNVLTVDGMGEFESTTLWAFDGQELEELLSVPLPHSIGRVYSSVTQYLGYLPNRHETKVMALAGYGEPTYADKLRDLVRTTEDGFEIEPEYFWTEECGMGFTNPSPLPKVFGHVPRQQGEDPLQEPYPDVAASLQEILFEVTSHLAEMAHERTGYGNLAMSGGVALNCENNGRLLTQLGFVDDVHVQPQAHDAGVALGAAFAVHHEETGEVPERPDHVFHGPEFEPEEIRERLEDWKLDCHEPGDLPGEVGERLARGEVVGWFQGAMEAGPRALGGRSILASPSDETSARFVNEEVKDRETWRPFAPTILHEHRSRYLAVDAEDPYMTLALPVTNRAQEELASAVHVTGTTRPQILERSFHPTYHEAVDAFREETGIPAVMNTSFNVSGEPIVCTPEEAVRDFAVTGMDALAIGPYVVEKGG